ncbi:MAG: hypothetical protein M5U30_14390 [Burkholderiaceae bacterium]|nr:hypothetical protein [Burkholderiaceae bacterium]
MLSWDEPISAAPVRPAPTRTPGLPADAASAPVNAEIALSPVASSQAWNRRGRVVMKQDPN